MVVDRWWCHRFLLWVIKGAIFLWFFALLLHFSCSRWVVPSHPWFGRKRRNYINFLIVPEVFSRLRGRSGFWIDLCACLLGMAMASREAPSKVNRRIGFFLLPHVWMVVLRAWLCLRVLGLEFASILLIKYRLSSHLARILTQDASETCSCEFCVVCDLEVLEFYWFLKFQMIDCLMAWWLIWSIGLLLRLLNLSESIFLYDPPEVLMPGAIWSL